MKKKIYLLIIIILFGLMVLFGGYNIFLIIKEYKVGNNTYDELQEDIVNDNNILEVDFSKLKETSEDIVAWINIDDLNIRYPVVQGNDNDYYLSHLIDGTYNGVGSIYMDYRNDSSFNDRHTIIYGHNLQNGTMFSNLEKYKNQEYYESHPYYYMITENVNYKIEIVSGYVTNVNDNSWDLDFKNDDEFKIWVDSTMDKSLIKSGVEPTSKDRFITLSTCNYEFDNARYVLVGIVVE